MGIETSARMTVVVLAFAVVVQPSEAQGVYPEFAPAAVRVSRMVLERYAGEYVYPAGNTVVVRLIGDTLFREIRGQQDRFVPLSETRFQIGPVFTAEFVTDQAGEVTQIVSDGVAVEFRLRRKGASASAPPALPMVARSKVGARALRGRL